MQAGPLPVQKKSKIGNRIARVLLAVERSGDLLPPADIELATQRFNEWLHGQDR